MKHVLFAAASTLFIGTAGAGAYAGSESVKPNQAVAADYRGNGTPHILNDRPWAEICPGNRALCDTTGSIKPDGRSS